MILGFLGTGRITSSVIEGIFKSNLKIRKIYISPRNKIIAKKLSKRFKKVTISKNNQQLIDKSNWVFLAVTPKVGDKILKNLYFKKNQKIISFISSINLKKLKKLIGNKTTIVRAIPLPPISLRKGPIPICPPNKQIKNFFNNLGSTIEIKSEKSSINFWATSGMMAPFYEILKVLSDWLVKKGIKRDKAQRYIVSLFIALSEDSSINLKKGMKTIVKESQTPGGLNEQALKELKRLKFYRNLEKSLDSILVRLKKV